MPSQEPITIVGGGLAGLTLGIGLRRRDVPVTITEAGEYPRHRVCGEFISGRGLVVLSRLDLLDQLYQAGAIDAKTAAFYSPGRNTQPRLLPVKATCISRYVLDAMLATKFTELGGKLLCGERNQMKDCAEGQVYATGRFVDHQSDSDQWFGLKIHARNISLNADLEMHVSDSGYVGLCRLNGDEVNICGLFRKQKRKNGQAGNIRELLFGPAGSSLQERLSGAEFDENSFCAVAGVSLKPRRATRHQEIRIGDAVTMIPPVTGNGMSMAFESAEIAMEPLANWSSGKSSWSEARQKIARSCDAAFGRRLFWAKWLQRLILTPTLQGSLISLANRSDWFWRLAFDRTR